MATLAHHGRKSCTIPRSYHAIEREGMTILLASVHLASVKPNPVSSIPDLLDLGYPCRHLSASSPRTVANHTLNSRTMARGFDRLLTYRQEKGKLPLGL
jgi:hypothetical protein